MWIKNYSSLKCEFVNSEAILINSLLTQKNLTTKDKKQVINIFTAPTTTTTNFI
ncbi:hypothetical protein J2S01_001034 [Pectinatus haikarae]|uniref:Uncharacterized protein n=1 Tax=Pectinatus haikarae TaxID=349096 RepID=A0ABT9Y657_9FIRM|nr:hypothetical protein [Pectinatus haikarae]